MNVLTEPVAALGRMFADCKPFAEWLGIPHNATETARRIHIDGITPMGDAQTMDADTLVAMRPFLLVYPDQRGYRFTRDAMPNCFSGNGQILAVLSRSYDPNQTATQVWTQAAAAVGKIISNSDANAPGLLEMANTPGYLAFGNLEVSFLGRTPPESVADYGDAYDVLLVFEY